jgi:LysM repeat protein
MAASDSTMEAPKAEPVDASTKHQVAKGETLTSIAKHYKIGVTDLLKMNKITDDRKLQIGQTLIIPPAKNPEPAPTQTENP